MMEQVPTIFLVNKYYSVIFSNIIQVFRLSAKPSKPTRKDISCILAIICSL